MVEKEGIDSEVDVLKVYKVVRDESDYVVEVVIGDKVLFVFIN